jgi:hypothetical protein
VVRAARLGRGLRIPGAPSISNHHALDLVEAHFVVPAVIELRRARAGTVEGIVTAAYLLTPLAPPSIGGADYQTTDLLGRLFHPEYRTTFKFGAVTLLTWNSRAADRAEAPPTTAPTTRSRKSNEYGRVISYLAALYRGDSRSKY